MARKSKRLVFGVQSDLYNDYVVAASPHIIGSRHRGDTIMLDETPVMLVRPWARQENHASIGAVPERRPGAIRNRFTVFHCPDIFTIDNPAASRTC